MEKGVFKFILRYSKKQQIFLLLMILLSYPFYYYSLDLPKTIVNEAIGGKEFPKFLFNFELDQINYLLTLCSAFLALVLINGGFKYFINVYRGVVGERMLRRVRYILIHRVMRFPLPHFRNVSEGEIVSMVTAETEPLGGFMGESISLPAFQGGMLITALIFMFVQNPILGFAAIALYPVQAWGIPKLQRKVNLLNKERVMKVRKLSERINELVAGSAEIHAHDTSQFELADFSSRLGGIYQIRYAVYRKKFFIKFLNNFLAQVTPFFFFSIGGYLVIVGELSLGALVAILAAYKDLSPPWKELLNFYQRMEDARIKYTQLIERFDPPGMFSDAVMAPSAETAPPLSGKITASNMTLEEDEGTKILEGVGFDFNVNDHVVLQGSPGSGKTDLARLLARQVSPSSGTLNLDGIDFSSIPESTTGRRIGYVDQDAYIRSGTIRENLFYGLKHYPMVDADYQSDEKNEFEKSQKESREAGNSELDINANWISIPVEAEDNRDENERLLELGMRALKAVGLDADVQTIGFRSTLSPDSPPELIQGMLKARETLSDRLQEPEYSGLVETWDRSAYNHNASVAENILFGTPVDETFSIETLGQNEQIQNALKKVGLYVDFVEMGRKVASLMVELFHDLPPGHDFFERFSFISADDLPDFQNILSASASGGVEDLTHEQRERLRQLPFKLMSARHRLGLIDDVMIGRLLAARKAFAEDLPETLRASVSFFDLTTYSPTSSILDNVLFGKIDSARSDASEKIQHLVGEVFNDLSLNLAVLEAGLNSEVGIAGRRLSNVQRQKLAIARNLAKDPDLLIVNEATGVFDPSTQTAVFTNIKEIMDGRGLIWVNGDIANPNDFDRVFQIEDGRAREATDSSAPDISSSHGTGHDDSTQNEVGMDTELLARIPFFAGLDRSRLKLLAFTSERQTLEPQEVLFQQGDSADEACVIVDGTFSIIAETAEGRVKVADTGRGGVIGELALLCEAPRTATVQANERCTILKISKDVFIQLIKDNPAVGANLSRILASKLEAMMRSMSAHYELYDPITGLPNKNLFLDHLKSAATVDQRNGQTSSVIFLNFPELAEMDYFKDLDRRQGLLRNIAARIKPVIRDADTFAHLEGLRFGVLARGYTEDQVSDLLLSRIIETLGAPLTIGDHTIDLGELNKTKMLGLDAETIRAITEQV